VRLDPGINQFFHSVADGNGLARHHDNAVEIIVGFAALLGVIADEVFSSENGQRSACSLGTSYNFRGRGFPSNC
jgi:hypothetical protein